MPFTAGVFTRLYSWVTDATNGIKINAPRMDQDTNDIATGLSTCILKDGTQTIAQDIPFNAKKITGLGAGTLATDAAQLSQAQSGILPYLNTVAGTNTITAAATPAISAYTEGQRFYFKAAGANTGATTLNVNALGAKNIYKLLSGGAVALTGGEIQAGQEVEVIYDGTQFQMISENSIGSATFKVKSFTYDVSTASGTQAITGVGFKPKAVLFIGGFTTGGNSANISLGMDDGTLGSSWFNTASAALFGESGSASIVMYVSGGNTAVGTISSFVGDGFNIGWTKTGSPTGTATILALCFR